MLPALFLFNIIQNTRIKPCISVKQKLIDNNNTEKEMGKKIRIMYFLDYCLFSTKAGLPCHKYPKIRIKTTSLKWLGGKGEKNACNKKKKTLPHPAFHFHFQFHLFIFNIIVFSLYWCGLKEFANIKVWFILAT